MRRRFVARARAAGGSGPFGLLLLALLMFAAPALAQEPANAFPLTVTDLAGRTVTVAREPRRILLGEGLQILSLSLVHPDPASVLAAWGDDLKTYDPRTYEGLVRDLPRLAAVPLLGTRGSGLSIEAALAAKPDLVILSLWQRPSAEALVSTLDGLGIPVVFVDFYVDPVRDTPASVELLGRLLGHPDKGRAFADFYAARLAAVEAAVAGKAQPSVLLNAYPGAWACCWSAGTANFGAFLAIAGGRNIGADRFPTSDGGQLSLEYVLAARPEVYIGTGLSTSENGAGLRLGAGVDAGDAAESLRAVVADPALASLPAVRTGRAYGLWNYCNGTPLNIVAIEAMAAWLHPDAPGVDPAATLAALNDRFLAAPLAGTFWTGLPAASETVP